MESLASTHLGGDPRVYYKDDSEEHRITEFSYHTNEDKWYGRVLARYPYDPNNHPNRGPMAAVDSVVSAISVDGTPRVHYIDHEHRDIYELSFDIGKNAWNVIDASEKANGICSLAIGAKHTSTINQGDTRIYFTDVDPFIHEIGWDGGWNHRDDLCKMDPIVVQNTLTSISYNGDPRIYYLADNIQGLAHEIHVHEIAWSGSEKKFKHIDVNAEANAKTAPAAVGSALTATTRNGDPCVYYLTKDRHVHELAWFGADGWKHRDVLGDAFGLPAAPGSSLASTILGGYPRVYYLCDDNHVHELSDWYGERWNHRDISCFADNYINWQAELPAKGSPLTAVNYHDSDPRVYYLVTGSIYFGVHELGWQPDVNWWRHENIPNRTTWIP